ncbi:Peptide methionine sulfoxide reductase MsrA [Entamoeba marina]
MKPTNLQPLSEVEKNIIINKGTEPPFVGEYCSTKTKGIYYCKQCNNPLYVSTAKFESSCGWPAFEEEIKGSVKRSIDKDGVRTEITCSFCGGHLGHVFVGEHLTKANVRHCVNSISLKFIEENKQQIIYVAGGCFWGVEHYLKQFGDVTVGYMGGDKPFPTYKEICRGNSGYYETVKIQFNPQENQLVDILKYFFEIHDFTDTNGQGPDRGEQYSSVNL